MTSVLQDPDNILKEGWLNKRSKYLKEWRRRWFVLTYNKLYTFKKEGKHAHPTETILLDECFTVVSAGEKIDKENAIKIETLDGTFYVEASSRQDKQAWLNAIGKCVLTISLSRKSTATKVYEDEDY